MTKEEILAMKPGRELDAFVAQWVMDGVTRAEINGQVLYYDLPYFSTDIAAAWGVFTHFGWQGQVSYSGSDWFCEIQILRSDSNWAHITAEGYTAPHAICIAALLSVEVEHGQG